MRGSRVLALVLSLIIALALGGQRPAAATTDVMLADFEQAGAADGITSATPIDTVSISQVFASEGSSAMQLDIAAYDNAEGKVFPRAWLDVGSTLAKADWAQSTYLHVAIVNASSERAHLYIVIRDNQGRYLQRDAWAEPFQYRAFSIKVADMIEAGVNVADLQHLQVSSERANYAKRLYIDDIRLTDRPTDEAAEQEAVVPALIAAMDLTGQHDTVSALLSGATKRIAHGDADPEKFLNTQAGTLAGQLKSLGDRINAVGTDLGEARTIRTELESLRWRTLRLTSFVEARERRPSSQVGIATADSMSMVYPRDLPCHCTFDHRLSLQLARGESEATQLVALPYGSGLKNAQVKIITPDAHGLKVAAAPVGSLNMVAPVAQRPATPTAFRPSIYEGWTPDPVLTDQKTVEVAKDDLQAFRIQVDASPTARPGKHSVEVQLSADGITSQRVRLMVEVWDITLPEQTHLRTAIGHDPSAYAEPYGVTDPAGIAELTKQKNEFLSRYKLQPDNIYQSIYGGHPPSVEELQSIAALPGGLRQFNMWYFDPRLFDLTKPETWDAQADRLFDVVQPYVDDYRTAGLIDKAYLYCCDETRTEYVALIKHVLNRFHDRFGDIEILTTAIDDQMGADNGLGPLIDWWVRDVPWYSKEVIDQRHAAGQEAWWYLHAGVANPQPNVFVGYDPGALRTLLGPMSHQSGVDGFLYYRVDRWYGHGVLDDGPLSNWDPRTWNDYAGDGSLFYPGADGPIPSLRLENMRDGLEDYDLLSALHQTIDAAPADTDPQQLAQAKVLLGATDVVHNSASFTRDPTAYRAWRAQVAKATETLTA